MRAFDRLQAVLEAIAVACIPLFPSFITLTNVAFPGVSVVPHPFAVALFAAMGVIAVIVTVTLLVLRGAASPLLWPYAAWLGAGLLSLAFGLNARDGSVFVTIAFFNVIWNAHAFRYYARPGVARAIWWSYLITGTLASIAAIAMVLLRSPAALYSIANGRAVGTFVLPGELAGYLIFFIPIAYALARTAASPPMRALAWTGCASGAIAMALSFSRTGWVGLAAGIGCLIAMRSPRGGIVRAGAVVAAALVLVLALFNEHHNPSENYTRLSIWQAATGVIDRFPLIGAGPFGFSKAYAFVRLPDGDATAFHAHSLYLTIFAELGIIGLAAFAWIVVTFWRALWERVRVLPPRAALLPLAIAAGVAGVLVQGLIDTVSVVLFGLLAPMLALGLASAQSPEALEW